MKHDVPPGFGAPAIISRRTHGQGYYLNDDRASGGPRSEADVLTCAHCQKILMQKGWAEEGGFCGRCQAPICLSCAGKMDTEGCTPIRKQIDDALAAIERRNALLR